MRKTGRRITRLAHASLAGVLAVVVFLTPVSATEPEGIKTGPVTNLPMPRFVSMKASEGNARRGPSLTHRIDWVFQQRDMPLRIVAEHGHWRRVEDRDGQGGWIHYSLLSGVRTVIVEENMLNMYNRPDASSPVTAVLEANVIARLGKCEPDWCQLKSGGYRGWVLKSSLWGVSAEELRD